MNNNNNVNMNNNQSTPIIFLFSPPIHYAVCGSLEYILLLIFMFGFRAILLPPVLLSFNII